MTGIIITVFVIGYMFIALESFTKVSKTGVALLMGIACWVLLLAGAEGYLPLFADKLQALGLGDDISHYLSGDRFKEGLAEVCETILFLMGAMTVVETVDRHGGFRFVNNALYTPNPKALLWKIVGMTFIMSATLDNMTTSIVMTMVIKNLVQDREMRMKYAGMIIIAANAGGAFSPIGDVTTIMLWIKGCVTTQGIILNTIIPSIVCAVVPALVIMPQLKGEIQKPTDMTANAHKDHFSGAMRNVIFFLGVGGLIFVPFFRALTGLPPFMGVLLDLAILWVAVEVIIAIHGGEDEDVLEKARVSSIIGHIDMSTILFFLGILLAVDALSVTGALSALGKWLDDSVGNIYIVDSLIGIFSSIIDNVPLVASAMGMYPISDAAAIAADPAMANYAQDGLFWELLAYCAGTGGSLLIIGSAAGVVVMGLEKLTFVWYLKKFTWLAFLGYAAGILTYWLEKLIVG